MWRRHALVGLSLAVAACATPQTDRLRQNPGAVAPKDAVANPVFFAQRTKECGPAALAMALVQSGVKVGPDDLVADVYNPGREGSLAPAMLAAARRYGRIAYPVTNLADLLRNVAAGRPVIVLQNLALEWYPQWHYAVAVGYDLEAGTVTLHSGRTAFKETTLEIFERTWRRGGYWGLLTLRPGEFPEPVDEKAYVKAIAGVERAGQAAVATEAYRAALERWPGNFPARMGLGNALYKAGQRRAAAEAFRAATRRHPEAADAYNNLAHVLAELGDIVEAERAARKAVALGGANADAYRKTLESVVAEREAASEGER